MKLIRTSQGTSWEDVAYHLNRTYASLKKAANVLYKEGYICHHAGGALHPLYRSIDVYKKGIAKVLKENYHIHGIMTSRADVLIEEIALSNHITTSQLRRAIKYVEDDYFYRFTYGIDKSSAALFERTNNIKFDFEKFEYILG